MIRSSSTRASRGRFLIVTSFIVILACCSPSSTAENSIAGEYTNQDTNDVSLRITSDTIQASSGPMTITFKYSIETVDGDRITAFAR